MNLYADAWPERWIRANFKGLWYITVTKLCLDSEIEIVRIEGMEIFDQFHTNVQTLGLNNFLETLGIHFLNYPTS